MKQWNKIYKDKLKKYNYYNVLEPHEDMSKVAEIFHKNNVKSILDLGCGAGRNLLFLAKNNFEMSGIDIAEDGIKVIDESLDELNKNADLRIGNILEKLPYKDNSFDAIISVQVMQHGREEELLKAIEEIKRILKPNGLIFFTLCGRISNGKIRYCLVKTAKLIAPRTYKPTKGDEVGLTHYIYDKKMIHKHYKDFEFLEEWKDSKDYYCFIAKKK